MIRLGSGGRRTFIEDPPSLRFDAANDEEDDRMHGGSPFLAVIA
jgi:hypothetical protein